MKVSKSTEIAINQFHYEEQVLEYLKNELSPEALNRISVIEASFTLFNHEIIIIERLGPSLFEALRFRGFQGLELGLIQSSLHEILLPLDFLSDLNLIHADIKPENILLESENSAHVKLIDFGSCCVQGDPNFTYVQSRYYRSPEVALGIPFGPKADIWSLGCVAAELFLGLPLFPSTNTYCHLYLIERTLGPFPLCVTDASQIEADIFSHETTNFSRHIKSREELNEMGIDFGNYQDYFLHETLDDIIMSTIIDENDEQYVQHLKLFLDLLHHMLTIDPEERYSANDAIRHPFFNIHF